MTTAPDLLTIALLADHEPLIAAVGEMRWREWGHPPEPEDRAWWVATTRGEAGRDRIPVTWVAIDGRGEAVGAVGLGEFDIEERRDTSPWVMGMIVRADRRSRGIGALLLTTLESWAHAQGYQRAWVATGRAADFYRKCGWQLTETLERESGEVLTVLTKVL